MAIFVGKKEKTASWQFQMVQPNIFFLSSEKAGM